MIPELKSYCVEKQKHQNCSVRYAKPTVYTYKKNNIIGFDLKGCEKLIK